MTQPTILSFHVRNTRILTFCSQFSINELINFTTLIFHLLAIIIIVHTLSLGFFLKCMSLHPILWTKWWLSSLSSESYCHHFIGHVTFQTWYIQNHSSTINNFIYSQLYNSSLIVTPLNSISSHYFILTCLYQNPFISFHLFLCCSFIIIIIVIRTRCNDLPYCLSLLTIHANFIHHFINNIQHQYHCVDRKIFFWSVLCSLS